MDYLEYSPSMRSFDDYNMVYSHEILNVSVDPTEDFHKYTLDWQEDHISWLIDDEEVHRLDKDDVTSPK